MTEMIDWRRYIHSDPNILAGKPVMRGTRISVEFLLGLFAGGWSEAIHAVFAFAAECMHESSSYALRP